jgi:hypothetical protein
VKFLARIKNEDAYITFPLKFSNVPISQFDAKLSNLRMKIKKVVLNNDVHERIRKKRY